MSRPTQILVGAAVAAILLLSGRSYSRGDLQPNIQHLLQTGSDALCSGHAQAVYAKSVGPSSALAPSSASGDKLRILHLIDEPTMQALMDRWFMRSHTAFEGEPDLVAEAPMWGPGFEGWNASASITANIAARYGSAGHFDAVLAYYNTDQTQDLGINPEPFWHELRELSSHGSVIIDRPHEMRDDRRVSHIAVSNVTLVLAPYPSEIIEYQHWTRDALFVHQPHPVDERLFEHPIYHADGSLVDRPTQVQLAGNMDASFYPLRVRLAELVKQGVIDAGVRPHPGYPDTLSDAERKAQSISASSLDAQLRDYSKTFGDAKICLVTASKWMYSVQKYGEAAAAGCLIVGSIPLDRKTDFEDFVVEIRNDMSDQQIVETINHWLAHDVERAERAARGQRYFLQKFASRSYVEDVIAWIRRAQLGQRGMVLPYEWRMLPNPLPNDG